MTEVAAPKPWAQAMAAWRLAGRTLSAEAAETYRRRLIEGEHTDWVNAERPRWRSVATKSAIAKDSLALCEALGITG